ncbi:hypothetical protein APSETT445_006959 [Aspergillus pseudonomiae]
MTCLWIYVISATHYNSEGQIGLGPESVEGDMAWQEFESKPWEETNVDIERTHIEIITRK